MSPQPELGPKVQPNSAGMTRPEQQRISTHDIDLGGGPVGCFLIHGLSGSTYEFQGLAEFLAEKGYRVRAKLLAGHGTSAEECGLVRAENWLQETVFHFTEFFLECETAFVIGLSMGAGLALHLSILYPVAGVVAMSPALTLNYRYARWYLPLMAPFIKSIPKSRLYGDRHPYYGYDRYPVNGLRAMLKMNRYIRKGLPKVTVPTLVMHSRADSTIPYENGPMVLSSIGSEDRRLLTYDRSSHVLPDGVEKEKVWADILDFVTRHTPEKLGALPVPESR